VRKNLFAIKNAVKKRSKNLFELFLM